MLRRRRARAEEGAGGPAAGRADVPARWRAAVEECDRLVGELTRLIGSAPAGPLRDRLDAVRTATARRVDEAAQAAQRAGEVERLAASIDIEGVTASYKRAKREVERASRRGEVPAALAASLDSLARQHASGHRLLNAVEQTGAHLEAVQARLREIVLSAAELTLDGARDDGSRAEAQAAALAGEVRALSDAFAELD